MAGNVELVKSYLALCLKTVPNKNGHGYISQLLFCPLLRDKKKNFF